MSTNTIAQPRKHLLCLLVTAGLAACDAPLPVAPSRALFVPLFITPDGVCTEQPRVEDHVMWGF